LIAYFDTSSLAKLYISEEGRDHVRDLSASASLRAASVIAYAEMRSVLGRKRRTGELHGDEYREAIRDFEADWTSLTHVALSEELATTAGNLAERHALRGMDAIHLASALWLRTQEGRDRIVFSTSDTALVRAAHGEGLSTSMAEGFGGSSGGALPMRERGARWRRSRKR
jgi:predicted nucleic acid-binding protein